MPKINPINVYICGKGSNRFQHAYETHVLSDGTFQTLLPEDQVEWISRLDLSGVQLTKNKADRPILKAKHLDDISRVVHAYGKSTLEVETTTERLIFYSVTLNVAYCTNPHLPGQVFTDGNAARRETGGDNDYHWHGPSAGGLVRSNNHTVGVAATVVDKQIHRMSGGRFHVEHTKARFVHGDESFGKRLCDFNSGVFPPKDYWSPTDPSKPRVSPGKTYQGDFLISEGLHYLPYNEEMAEFFYTMMMNLATLAERLRLFFGDGKTDLIENLNNGKAKLLLGGK